MLRDSIKYAIANLLHRRLRSFLSILSILIGITAIFALVSFGQGIKIYIDDMAEQQGTDKLMLTAKSAYSVPGEGMTFTDSDISYIEKINGVSEISGMSFLNAVISDDEKDIYTYAIGVPTDIRDKQLVDEIFTISVEEGRDLKKGDELKAVVGYSYLIPDRIFKQPLHVGSTITVNHIPVKVVGFYEEVGNPQDDSQVYLTLDGIELISPGTEYAYILIRSEPDQDPEVVADRINDKFRKYKDQKEGEEAFTVQTFADAIKAFTTVIDILNIVLVLIALVSVFVAAVNITNTMYTSVIERTQEIGVMKSLGSPNSFILMSFITESGLLGFIGGAVGILLGLLVTFIAGKMTAMAGLSMLRPGYPIWLFVVCISFSTIVGLLAGYLPAKQASKLSPVDALRYE